MHSRYHVFTLRCTHVTMYSRYDVFTLRCIHVTMHSHGEGFLLHIVTLTHTHNIFFHSRFLNSFLHSRTQHFNPSLAKKTLLYHSFMYSLIRVFTHSRIHSFVYSLIHIFTHSRLHPLKHALTNTHYCTWTHSLTHSRIHSHTYTHFFTHAILVHLIHWWLTYVSL